MKWKKNPYFTVDIKINRNLKIIKTKKYDKLLREYGKNIR